MSDLVIQDYQGIHNKNLDASRARLIKGGSWKKQRIASIIPTIAPIPPKVYLTHCALIFPPNNGVARLLADGMEVGEAYSTTIQNILDHSELKSWEYVLTIEHDNMPPQDGILKLVEDLENHKEFSAIGGLYFTKGEGGVAQIWGDPKDPVLNFRPQVPIDNQIVECCGTGMGFTLFRLKMFKDSRLRKPWFLTQKGVGGTSTQDLYFWSDARKYGYRCAVDCSVKVGHYDSISDIVW